MRFILHSLLLGLFFITGSATVVAQQQDTSADPVEIFGFFGDIVYGEADAKIEVIEFASLTCPHCASFHKDQLPAVLQQHVETGKVRFVFRNFILNDLDMAVAVISRCRDMEFAKKAQDKLFETQQTWSRSPDVLKAVVELFAGLGMERPEFDKCVQNQPMAKYLNDQTRKDAEQYNIKGTPTVTVNGITVRATFDAIDSAVAANELKQGS